MAEETLERIESGVVVEVVRLVETTQARQEGMVLRLGGGSRVRVVVLVQLMCDSADVLVAAVVIA